MSSTNYEADLLDLVREAYDAQEAFDQWDNGQTVGGFVVGGRRTAREVALDVVIQEMDEANLTLVMYIAENHEKIIEAITARGDGHEAERT
jgi:hypothetical protein